jgi:molecular chaperone DnaK (HSP70)
VTFEIDVNGILRVSAEDKGTGNKNNIVINNNQNRLSPEEIEKMIKDAEKFADEDKKAKERVDAKNELESYGYSLKNQLNDKEKLGGKLAEEDRKKVSDVVESKIKWLDDNENAELDQFKNQKKELEDVVNPIISKIYQDKNSNGKSESEKSNEKSEDKDEL